MSLKRRSKFGYRLTLDPVDSRRKDVEGVVATLERVERKWLVSELEALVLLQALVEDVPPERILDRLRSLIDKRGGLGKSPRGTLGELS